MALRGSAFLALWNDVDPARDDEYNCWHTGEHVPERVGIRGILAGRRYVARERRDDRYFTLYELEDLATLASAGYADVVERPTAWSLSMRPSLRNFRRHPCTTMLSLGCGIGGAMATMRVASDPRSAEAIEAIVEPLLATAAITAAHAGAVDAGAGFPLQNTSAGDAAEATCVMLVEGATRADVDAAALRIATALAPHDAARAGIEWRSFDLVFAIDRDQLRDPDAIRQPPRPDLRARWQ